MSTEKTMNAAPVDGIVILPWSDFEVRIRDWASTAAMTPPWSHAAFWAEHIVPFIADAHRRGDRAVKAVLENARPKMMESQESAFEWLLSFLEDEAR